jgi:hypothetical protein
VAESQPKPGKGTVEVYRERVPEVIIGDEPMPGRLGALKPDIVVLKRNNDGRLVSIQVADVCVSYPGRAGDGDDESRTLKGKAQRKVEKYRALVEELTRRHQGDGVVVEFHPLVFASVGAVPSATVHAMQKLVHEEGRCKLQAALSNSVCSILKYAHRMWQARCSVVCKRRSQLQVGPGQPPN